MDNNDTSKKYALLENILQSINSKAIALQGKEIKRNNVILDSVTDTIIGKMKKKDPLFGGLYREKFYGGSYYDNLKVGNPNEFDLDLILHLPVILEPRVICSDRPGFVHVEIKEYHTQLNRSEAEKARLLKMLSLLNHANLLSTNKTLQWMERVIHIVLNEMGKDENGRYVDVVFNKTELQDVIRIYVKVIKCAPAFTLKLSGMDVDGSGIHLDIDLVPCFQFTDQDWPSESNGYKPNTSSTKTRFFVVPKTPRGTNLNNSLTLDTHWRLSFQEQERQLISGGKRNLKPSLRLLKKIRDQHNHKIASYFIKTIFLWTVEQEEMKFWEQPLSVVFMAMLKKYEEYMRANQIPYYWNKNYNLIENLKDATKLDIANTLQNIITTVNKNLGDTLVSDPYVIGKYLLSKEELEKLRSEVKLSAKQERQLQVAHVNSLLNSVSIGSVSFQKSTQPPLRQLEFEPELVKPLRPYSDEFEDSKKLEVDSTTSQFNSAASRVSSDTEVVSYLKKIDEKIDKLMDKFDKVCQQSTVINSKVCVLEERVRVLENENTNLRHQLNQVNNGRLNYIETL